MRLPWWTYTPEKAETARKVFMWAVMALYWIVSLLIIAFFATQQSP